MTHASFLESCFPELYTNSPSAKKLCNCVAFPPIWAAGDREGETQPSHRRHLRLLVGGGHKRGSEANSLAQVSQTSMAGIFLRAIQKFNIFRLDGVNSEQRRTHHLNRSRVEPP